MNRKKDPLFFAAPRRRGITEGFFCLKNGLEYTPHEPEHEAALFFKRHPREGVPRYWSQNNPPYEVDFLIQRENDIFPVEVKSEANTTSKSMKKFKELFPDKVKLRIRFSLDNLKLDDDVLNIPLFMADQADRLIGLALEKRKH